MSSYARGLLVASVVLIAIGGYSIFASNVVTSYKSTFNLLPLRYMKIAANLGSGTQVTGHFQETSGRAVTFDIMSSVQFASFQTKASNESLYSVPEKGSASVSFSTTAQDTYYLVFRHGVAYLNTTETVSFDRSYVHPDLPQLLSGIVLLSLGMVEGYWGFRPKRAKSATPAAEKAPEKYW
jgi:hypothetical protein